LPFLAIICEKSLKKLRRSTMIKGRESQKSFEMPLPVNDRQTALIRGRESLKIFEMTRPVNGRQTA
jgi:hypothetical protein